MGSSSTQEQRGREGRGGGPGPGPRVGLFLLGWAVVATSGAFGQGHRLSFDQLSREEGLSQVSVNSILQDRQGFLWVGTQDGLNRYDGYQFTVFKHDPLDPQSLSQNLILGLSEDREGVLWVTTNQPGMINRFDPRTETMTRLLHDPEDPQTLLPSAVNPGAIYDDGEGFLWLGTGVGGINKLEKATGRVQRAAHRPGDESSLGLGGITFIQEDRSGAVWVGVFGSGLYRRLPPSQRKGERFERFSHDPRDPTSLSDDRVLAMLEDRAGDLWVATAGGGLNRLDPATGRSSRYRHDPRDPASLATELLGAPPGFGFRILMEDSRRNLWVVTAAGLSRLDPERRRTFNYRNDPGNPESLSHNAVTGVLEDRSGTVWAATQGGGLNTWEPESDSFVVWRNEAGDPKSLASDFITNLYESRSGILWIGTSNAGLNKFSRQKHKFGHFVGNPSAPGSLADNMVFSILQDSSGELWVGTLGGGLHRLDRERETVIERYFQDSGGSRSLGSNFVRAVLEDSRGRLWVGTVGAGLALVDRQRGRVVRRYVNDSANPESLSNNGVFSVVEDSTGTLWVSTGFGWNRFDPEKEVFRAYFNVPTDPTSLVNSNTRFTYEDRSGRLWIGTAQGLSRFDRETETFTNFRHDFRDSQSLSHDNIMDIHEDEEGIFWIATYGGGLNRYDPAAEVFTPFTTKDGLPNDSVYTVLPDDEGNFWLSTNSGLSKFDPRELKFTNYSTDDGLQSMEFNGRAFYKSPSGEMFFGGTDGFNTFFPEEIEPSDYIPPVLVTGLATLEGSPAPDLAAWAVEEVRLTHQSRFIDIRFAALDYSQPEQNQYAYMLEGFDPDWIHSGSQRHATYSNLPPGRYLFRVKGSNGDGIWNEEGASLRLVVTPPPWKSWWAYMLYTLTSAGLVFGYVRWKTVAHKDELERERVEAEARRKTEELEQARAIQLSMLPPLPPRLQGLEIAALMKTASEVGGDYYDFFPQEDGSLFVATGDATGHGISAGMLVAMTKSALRALGVESPHRLLERLNAVIREVNPARMKMALNLAQFDGDRILLSSAGMPPAFLYRAATGEVEEVLIPGLPLGAMGEIDYAPRELSFGSGDVLLLISDGLPELRDRKGRALGYQAISRRLAAKGGEPVQGIIDGLVNLAEEWSEEGSQDDDITIVVVRRPG